MTHTLAFCRLGLGVVVAFREHHGGELSLESFSGTVEARANCSDGEAHDIGYLLVRESFSVEEDQGFSELLGEMIDRFLDMNAPVAKFKDRGGVVFDQFRTAVLELAVEVPLFGVVEGGFVERALRFVDLVEEQVFLDAKEPGFTVRAFFILLPETVSSQKRVLDKVFGVSLIAG